MNINQKNIFIKIKNYLFDHRPFGNHKNSVLPGSTILLEIIWALLKNKKEENFLILKNICFLKPLLINEEDGDVFELGIIFKNSGENDNGLKAKFCCFLN